MAINRSKDAVVIGGGVIGASIAYFLQKKGWSVALMEKDRFGSGASHGNCGLIVADHLLPLNSIGNLIKGLWWMFKKEAPLYIRPRYDPPFFNWLTQFVRHCSRKSIRRAARGRAAMLQGAINQYRTLIGDEALDCEWEVNGALYLFASRKEFEAYRSVDALNRRFNVGATPLDPSELSRLEPAVGNHMAGAWFSRHIAQIRPDTLMAEFRRILTRQGVEILEQTEVTGFEIEQGRAVAAVTDRGRFRAGQFVLATGAWTPLLADILHCKLPIAPGKGYSVTLSRSLDSPSIPCFFHEASVVATPWSSGLRLGGTMEFSGYDSALNRFRLDALFSAARRYLLRTDFCGIEEEWCGLRPMTCDGLPIIDRIPGLKNVMMAAGHNMLGLTMAPGTGKLVAEMLNGDAPHVDPSPYRIARFQ